MAKRNSKNLSRVQSMLDGTYKTKIVVGDASVGRDDKQRKIGDRWTDSDGKEWEQKDGYIASVSKLPGIGIFAHQCKDCKSGLTKSFDVDTHKRTQRCYYCQIDWEENLKTITIGKNGNKWQFWVRLMELQRWIAGRDELEHWIYQKHNEKKMAFDMSVANAMANDNVSMEIKKNT